MIDVANLKLKLDILEWDSTWHSKVCYHDRLVLLQHSAQPLEVPGSHQMGKSPSYCIAGNFRGRKLSQILQFCSYSRKFSP